MQILQTLLKNLRPSSLHAQRSERSSGNGASIFGRLVQWVMISYLLISNLEPNLLQSSTGYQGNAPQEEVNHLHTIVNPGSTQRSPG